MNTKTFHDRIRASITDRDLQIALDGNALRRKIGRLEAFSSLPDLPERRLRAHAIKADVISHLDDYLSRFMDQVSANGIIVHRASDAKEAIRIFLQIAENHNAHLVAKSKSMLSEEIDFNHTLEMAGIQVVETDLGEYIVQLRGERPSHILTPAVHLRRAQVGQLFHDKLGTPYTEDIPEMVATARQALRKVFLDAEIGVSGVNFGVAESGTLCLVTNEGNGRMVTSIPRVHVALMGIERLVPSLDDLALFLSLLPRSGTGQKLSVYTSLIHAPKRVTDADGPAERHLILVDNGRSALSTSPLAESLYCIRCGACLNACPVFREIGGHAYVGRDGSIAPYPGPIGSVLSPGMLDCENYGQLAQASTLCGACQEACPVNINLPELLLRVRAGETGRSEKNRKKEDGIAVPGMLKLALKAFRFAAANPYLFSLGQGLGGLISHVYSPAKKYMRLPAWTGWGYSKDFPRLSISPFRAHWKRIKQAVDHPDQSIRQLAGSAVPERCIDRSMSDRFSDELVSLGARVYHLPEEQVQVRLAALLHEQGIDRVCVDAIGQAYISAIPFVMDPDPSIRVGVTGALAGIAETGSLVLVGGEGRPLTTSLLPEIHIAILRVSDLVPTLSDGLHLPEIRPASSAVIITGPSRTADIEMTLTLGVHGPKELHVFLIENNK
jgi:L-lactate dehydrogenase complex protein LldF